MGKSIKEMIVIHVCYRDVFNAPVNIAHLKKWMGIDQSLAAEFEDSLSQLVKENYLSQSGDYLTIPSKVHLSEEQNAKDKLTHKLLSKGRKTLMNIGRLPFVKFIGVSGSIAANNPTINTHGIGIGKIDLDLFVITSKNTLWMFLLFERIYTNFIKLMRGGHFYCFNFVTEASFLEIYNKNFFTATEIINVKPVVDKNAFAIFIHENSWYKQYYKPREDVKDQAEQPVTGFIQKVFWLPNFVCFSLFCIGRALKRFELSALAEMNVKFNPANKCNLKRIANPRGGFQEQIRIRFEELMRANFTKFYSNDLISRLFPENGMFVFDSLNVHDGEHGELFKKYKLVDAESSI